MQTRIGQYVMCDDQILGEGGFGEVKLAYRGTARQQYALKRVIKSKLSPSMRAHLPVEVEVLQRCKHPNIIALHEVIEAGDDVYFVMDYVGGGDMFDFVVRHQLLDESLARRLFGQLADAVHHLHNHQGVVHHDIKLENCLLDIDPRTSAVTARLTDFGLCCPVQHPSDVLTKFSGTEAYSAPEVLQGRPYNGGANDIYALGVVLYIAVTGAYPFDSEIDLQVAQQTNYTHLATLPFPRGISRDCRDLVVTMLDPNPRKRPTIERVLAHPFVAPYLAELKKEQEGDVEEEEDEEDKEEEIDDVCEISVADEEVFSDDDPYDETAPMFGESHDRLCISMVDEDFGDADDDDMLQ